MAWIVGGLIIQMLTMKTLGFSIATGLLLRQRRADLVIANSGSASLSASSLHSSSGSFCARLAAFAAVRLA